MMFDIKHNVTYQQLDSWIHMTQEFLRPLSGHRVLISLPTAAATWAAYMAARDLVAAVAVPVRHQDDVAADIQRWDCVAALVSFDAGYSSQAILPGVWLWRPPARHDSGCYDTGMALLANSAEITVIPSQCFETHFGAGTDSIRPSRDQSTWLGLPMWSSWGMYHAWNVYRAGASCVIEQFCPGAETLVHALDHCDIVHCDSTLLKQSLVQPRNHGLVYVNGTDLAHEEKMQQAYKLGIPVMHQYGSIQTSCVSRQDQDDWYRPGAGRPHVPYRVQDGVLWVQRVIDQEWWCMHDQVHVENDGQITVLGHESLVDQ
jgi:hypothetical protein